MKAICLTGGRMRHYADSAFHRNRHPLFVADTAVGWSIAICPAIKISRLGTHIAAKFASRYYDSLVPVCLFMPTDDITDIAAAPESRFVMDSALCVGDPVAVAAPDAPHCLTDNADSRLIFTAADLAADLAVSRLSQIATLKMGDLIIFADRSICRPLAVGSRLRVSLDGLDSIDIAVR